MDEVGGKSKAQNWIEFLEIASASLLKEGFVIASHFVGTAALTIEDELKKRRRTRLN